VLAENCVAYVELYYAAPLAGRVLVPLNHRLHPAEWRTTLERDGARLLYVAPELADRVDVPPDVAVLDLSPAPATTHDAPVGAKTTSRG